MMAIKLLFFGLIILFLNSLLPQSVASDEQGNNLRTYIVHVKEPENRIALQSEGDNNLVGWYESFLPPTIASSDNNYQRPMIHAYKHVGSAFAARLTPEEAQDMANRDGVLMVREEKLLHLHTTHSPTFLGLTQGQEQGLWNESNLGKGVIIGVLDTGIFPSHPSFNDEGMAPPPAKWKGKCHFEKHQECNNKIIGAISLINSSTPDIDASVTKPPYDDNGHGTHTASTAAGNFVMNANAFGHANGTASGMAPHAHLAVYKVCNFLSTCSESAILAAFDIAIEDGVDIITMSFGTPSFSFYEDVVAVGTFAATQKGILVSASGANVGPGHGTVENDEPWLLSVGASTIDRRIVASVKLGSGKEFDGESLFLHNLIDEFNPSGSLLPLIHLGVDAPCTYSTLKPLADQVKGKIVLCFGFIQQGQSFSSQSKAVKSAGGAAMILANDYTSGYTTLVGKHFLPASQVSHAAGLEIMSYIDSSAKPEATIMFRGTVIEGEPSSNAPVVAFFSSRGPSVKSPGILKPDIIGPGVNILAAWPVPDTSFGGSYFKIMSGTSMSCPHLSGVAALLKSSHPDWSPAAIKSAMMTTASTTNLEGNPIVDERLLPADLFAIGAGHVNPSRANDPGLVYDMESTDIYTGYLCGLNLTSTQVGIIVRKQVNCSLEKVVEATELNYPSFSVLLGSHPLTYNRSVTNVGPADSNYSVKVVPPKGVNVSVEPQTLVFKSVKERANYSVTFTAEMREANITHGLFAEGFLEWFSDKHSVKTPISITFI